MDIARSYGKITPIGYFPDSFGNAGQMPQIFKQAGMELPNYLGKEITEEKAEDKA
mgnify:CR=1 FL=1